MIEVHANRGGVGCGEGNRMSSSRHVQRTLVERARLSQGPLCLCPTWIHSLSSPSRLSHHEHKMNGTQNAKLQISLREISYLLSIPCTATSTLTSTTCSDLSPNRHLSPLAIRLLAPLLHLPFRVGRRANIRVECEVLLLETMVRSEFIVEVALLGEAQVVTARVGQGECV